MKSFIKHFRQWNIWRKYNTNGFVHKLLVLFKIIHSPTFYNVPVFEYTVPDEVEEDEEEDEEEDAMPNTGILEKFKEVMKLTNEEIIFWVPNAVGRNTIKVRLKDHSELIFSYSSPRNWRLETAESYVRSLKKDRPRKREKDNG